MFRRTIPLFVAMAAVTGCATAPLAPPALAYGEQSTTTATYVHADTTSVDVSAMGQRLQLSQHGRAVYDVAFTEAPSGVSVSVSVRTLEATINQPMGGSLPLDEGSVEGPVEFTLDRVGNSVLSRSPRVTTEASQLVSGLGLAHTFFPALPGRPVVPGDSWVDSLTFSGEEGGGTRSESSVLRYTVAGDTVVDGRTLLHIGFEGSATLSNEMEVSGMAVSQSSEVEVDGLVLWDVQTGLMVEHVRRSAGTGTAQIPIVPVPLPILLSSFQRTTLEAPGRQP